MEEKRMLREENFSFEDPQPVFLTGKGTAARAGNVLTRMHGSVGMDLREEVHLYERRGF